MRRVNKPLYLHLPFCSHLCHYCDFPKVLYSQHEVDDYLDMLKREIDSYELRDCSSLYVGGGTPSSLSLAQLDNLFSYLAPLVKKGAEWTVECNVENIDADKLALFRHYGVNRLSFGVQSFNDERLKAINRHHRGEDALRAIALAREYGFNNLNADLIYGFENQTIEDLDEDITQMLALDIPHLSTYCLSVSPHTVFANQSYPEPDQDQGRMMYDHLLERFRKAGYRRYEVSNFARPGYESCHNQVYWHNENYVGAGLGAHGYLDGIRYANTRSLEHYLQGQWRISEEKVSLRDDMLYEIMLKWRMEEGLSLIDFTQKFGADWTTKLVKALTDFITQGLVVEDKTQHRLAMSDEGMMILDTILRHVFMSLDEEEHHADCSL